MSGFWIPDGLDPEEAADFARQEVAEEIAYYEERDRELEEAEERKREERDAAFDASLDRWQEENW